MSWQFCETKQVKTRKVHKCNCCGREIPKGSTHIITWRGLWDGKFESGYSCHFCEDNHEYFVDDDETLLDFWEGMYYVFENKLSEIEYDNMELDGDYLLIKDENDNVLHKEYIPVIREGGFL